MKTEFNYKEEDFIADALNAYFHQAIDKLNEPNLGDIQEKNLIEIQVTSLALLRKMGRV